MLIVRFVVKAIVRLLVTLMLKNCLGHVPWKCPNLALLGTVVATVIILGRCVVSPITIAEKTLAQPVPAPPPIGILAVILKGLVLRNSVGRPLVGVQFPFPRARIRTRM